MALTRKLLKGMGLTDEQVDTIIEAHTDTVDGLKAEVAKYKTDAENRRRKHRLTAVQNILLRRISLRLFHRVCPKYLLAFLPPMPP